MIERLLKLVKYNRDWMKYIGFRREGSASREPLMFRLRNGQAIKVRRDGRFVLNEIYLDRVYDVPDVNIAECSSVLDLGANVRVFALYVASRAPHANIHCFEPSAKNFDLLVQNLSANQATSQPYKLAVCAKNGTASLNLNGISVGYSICSGTGPSENVQTVDMTEVFKLTGVDRFDFVKMDVEGAELEILANCTDEQLRKMSAISMEWHHSMDELQSAVNRFRQIGFHAQSQIVHGHVRYLKARLLA